MRKALIMNKLSIVLTFAVLAAGCAKSQNPVKQYENVPGIAPYEEQVRERKYAACFVSVHAPPTMIVRVGETSSEKIYLRGLDNPGNQNVSFIGAPEGLTLTKGGLSEKGQEFTVSMKGSSSVIPNSLDIAPFEVSIVPTVSTPGKDCSDTMGIVVARSKDSPVIKKVSAPGTIDLTKTEDRSVTVTFVANGAEDVNDLVIVPRFDWSASSKENPILDISTAVRLSSGITATGNSNFKAIYELDPEIINHIIKEKVPADYKKPEIEMVFSLTVINLKTNRSSQEQNVVIKMKRSVVETK